jgi:hypothetical protein
MLSRCLPQQGFKCIACVYTLLHEMSGKLNKSNFIKGDLIILISALS